MTLTFSYARKSSLNSFDAIDGHAPFFGGEFEISAIDGHVRTTGLLLLSSPEYNRSYDGTPYPMILYDIL